MLGRCNPAIRVLIGVTNMVSELREASRVCILGKLPENRRLLFILCVKSTIFWVIVTSILKNAETKESDILSFECYFFITVNYKPKRA